MNIVGIHNHQDEVDMGSLDDYVAYPDRMKRLRSSQAALHNRLAQGIGEEQESLF